ncbi:MAG: dihydrofolate reductase family protein [Candidatus Acidiferrales bacterium]
MGRVTYLALAEFSAAATDELSLRMSALPKFVLSSTLKKPLPWKNTRMMSGDLAREICALKEHPGEPLRAVSSISLVKSLMQLGLVDRLRLMVFPLVLGSAGREPIYAGYPQSGLELLDTKVLDGRLILLEYRPARKAAT